MERKKIVSVNVQNCPCGTVDAKIDYVLGLLVHRKVMIDFGRKT